MLRLEKEFLSFLSYSFCRHPLSKQIRYIFRMQISLFFLLNKSILCYSIIFLVQSFLFVTWSCGVEGRKAFNWSNFDDSCLKTSLNKWRFIDVATIITMNDSRWMYLFEENGENRQNCSFFWILFWSIFFFFFHCSFPTLIFV